MRAFLASLILFSALAAHALVFFGGDSGSATLAGVVEKSAEDTTNRFSATATNIIQALADSAAARGLNFLATGVPESGDVASADYFLLARDNTITVTGCTGDYDFLNGEYRMAANGIYYNSYAAALKQYRLLTHYVWHGPLHHEIRSPVYETRYGLFSVGSPGAEDTLLFQSTGYPDTPAPLDSTYAATEDILAVEPDVKLPTVTSTTGQYGQLYKVTFQTLTNGLGGSGGAQTPWTSDIDAAGFNLNSIGFLGVGISEEDKPYPCTGVFYNPSDSVNVTYSSGIGYSANSFDNPNVAAGNSDGAYRWMISRRPDSWFGDGTEECFVLWGDFYVGGVHSFYASPFIAAYDNVNNLVNLILCPTNGAWGGNQNNGAVIVERPIIPSGGIQTAEGDVFYPHTSGGNLIWTTSP